MAWPSTSSPSVRGSSSITTASPRALSASGASTSSLVAGGSRIICLANAQVPSRRSAARRRDKESVVPPAVFLSSVFPPDPAKSTAASYSTQRPGPTRPCDPVDLHLHGPTGRHPQFRGPTGRSLRPFSVAPSTALLLQSHPAPSAAPTKSWYPTATKIPLLLPCLPTLASAGQVSGATPHCVSAMASAHGSSLSWYRGIERMVASDRGPPICTTKMGGEYLEEIRHSSRGCSDINTEIYKDKLMEGDSWELKQQKFWGVSNCDRDRKTWEVGYYSHL